MKAHVGRVLAALTVEELREVRDRLDALVRDASHPGVIPSAEDLIVARVEVAAPGEDVAVPGVEVIVPGEDVNLCGAPVVASRSGLIVASGEQESLETVDDRSGWILERRGDLGDSPHPPVPVHRGWVAEG